VGIVGAAAAGGGGGGDDGDAQGSEALSHSAVNLTHRSAAFILSPGSEYSALSSSDSRVIVADNHRPHQDVGGESPSPNSREEEGFLSVSVLTTERSQFVPAPSPPPPTLSPPHSERGTGAAVQGGVTTTTTGTTGTGYASSSEYDFELEDDFGGDSSEVAEQLSEHSDDLGVGEEEEGSF